MQRATDFDCQNGVESEQYAELCKNQEIGVGFVFPVRISVQ